MTLNPQRRIPDNLKAELTGGLTVEELIAERFGRREPDERRTKLGTADGDPALGEALDLLALDLGREP